MAVFLAGMAVQPSADWNHAEQLARTGRTQEAIEAFSRIVERNPGDIDARLWIARLELRLGKTDAAEARFRAVVHERPQDVDARIGLGVTLLRQGAWPEALDVLLAAEPAAGDNADLFGALARAYRRAGDDARAMDYFTRAKARAPDDPDIVSGFEDTVRAYGHSLVLDGFVENAPEGSASSSVTLEASMRVAPRVHLESSIRLNERSGTSDALVGGGVWWRAGRATTFNVRGLAGPGNTTLARVDLSASGVRYMGAFEWGGNVRTMAFADADVVAASPVFAWDRGRWRLDTRYTYSRSHFDATDRTAGDHSVMLRETWRAFRRVWLTGTYAYGIESFEVLTTDRLGQLGGTTLAAGLRISTPTLSVLHAGWEHQRRSNSTTINRFTVSLAQSVP